MNAQDFVFWLRGYLDAGATDVEMIKTMVNIVKPQYQTVSLVGGSGVTYNHGSFQLAGGPDEPYRQT